MSLPPDAVFIEDAAGASIARSIRGALQAALTNSTMITDVSQWRRNCGAHNGRAGREMIL